MIIPRARNGAYSWGELPLVLGWVFASEVRGRMRLRGGGLRSSSETIETVAATIVEGKYGAQSMSVSSKQSDRLCY